MKSTQNEKISQIKSSTLVVGIDIAKHNHYARAFDFRGIELSKLLKFSNTAEGFNRLIRWMQNISEQHCKTESIIGMEPTGHYWFTLGDYLKEQGHKLAMVNPFHVKRTKEFDDNSPSKSDRKDPKTIAMLVKDGRYSEVYIAEDAYQELREAVGERDRLVQCLTSVKNRVIRWIDIHFPEFITIFKDWRGQAAFLVLRHFPTPEKIVSAGIEKIEEIWKSSMKRSAGRKRAQQLLKAAGESIGRKIGLAVAETSLQNLLTEYELYVEQLGQLEQLMKELLMQVPNAGKLLDIKGVGVLTAAVFVGEAGDISRFADPRQIQKLAGLSLVENSSGKHKGKTRISRRGRKRLRKGLFLAMIAILATNPEFRMLHQRNLTREKNPLTKMQSIIALCGKLIRVFFGIMKNGNDYSAEKMLGDIERGMRAAA